jgi:Flp pilus assembly protein TadB
VIRWPVAALVLCAAAMFVWTSTDALVVRRLHDVLGAGGSDVRAGARTALGRTVGSGPGRRWLLAAVAGTAGGLLVGGLLGLVAGVVGTVAAERLLRRSTDDSRAERAVAARHLPVACDLLAVCLSAGMPLTGALSAVGSAVPGPVGHQLSRMAVLGRLGADPRRAWADVPAHLRPLGRIVERAGESGARAAPALVALAADCRAQTRAGIEAAIRRAGIWVLAPLGLCFLPAFVCLGVVPLILGVAGEVFR